MSWVLGHKIVVVVAWLVVAAAGALTAPTTSESLSYDFSLPGQPAHETNTEIVERFGGGGLNDPLLLVSRAEPRTFDDPVAVRDFQETARNLARVVPGTRIVTPADDRTLVGEGGAVAVAVLYPTVTPGPEPYVAALPALRGAVDDIEGIGVAGQRFELTGALLLAEGSAGGDRGALAEILLGGLGALIVLVLVFGSLLAAVPLVIAAASILGTFLCLLLLTSFMDVSFVVQFLVGLIGLGVAIDYSLLIVMRWREERAGGADNDAAVRTAMATAGRSVVFSGVTVAVSLAALVLVPLPFLRSIGLGGLLIPLLSVATSLTLLPVLLATIGPKLQWPRKHVRSPVSRTWGRIARWVIGHRWLTIIGSVVVLLALAAPMLGLALGTPQISAFGADTAESRTARAVTDADLPVGVFRPVEVLVEADAVETTVRQLGAVEGVAGAVAPAGDGWRDQGDQLVQVWTAADPSSAAGRETLDRVRALEAGAVGGTPAEDADFVEAVYGDVGWVILGVVVVTFLLLARALRSLWLPVKALLLNAVSLGAAYGITVLIWQDGFGSDLLFGASASGVITTWVPIAAFAFLFGLSMDYEVFILARMRESYDEHGDTPRAVVDGIANTGRLVTSAALILFLAFVALSTVPAVEVKILATTLALGIAIDSVIVRGLLAPALVSVLGRANWLLPRPLATLLRVRPSHQDTPPRITSAAGGDGGH